MPVYFLYGQGIELALKAYLRAHGFAAQKLAAKKHYGHDLRKLYEECCRSGLRLPGDHCGAMAFLTKALSHIKWEIEFRYVGDFGPAYPSLEMMQDLSVELTEKIRPAVGAKPLTVVGIEAAFEAAFRTGKPSTL